MPTYEYACTSCGEHLEVAQSFRDDPLTVCPACGGVLRKVFGSIGVVFKGSGFYKTDSRPAAKSTSSKTDSAASAGSGDTSAPASNTGDGSSAGPSKDTSTGPSKDTSTGDGAKKSGSGKKTSGSSAAVAS